MRGSYLGGSGPHTKYLFGKKFHDAVLLDYSTIQQSKLDEDGIQEDRFINAKVLNGPLYLNKQNHLKPIFH